VIDAATATTPNPYALLGHLRAIGVVAADGWAESVRDLACEQQLVTPMPGPRQFAILRSTPNSSRRSQPLVCGAGASTAT
jgi:hypothetical protein